MISQIEYNKSFLENNWKNVGNEKLWANSRLVFCFSFQFFSFMCNKNMGQPSSNEISTLQSVDFRNLL